MSEMTQQKQVTILLVVVAVLLAAIVGILIYQANAVPGPTVDASTTSQTAQDAPAAATPQATGVPAAAPEFDEATAPKVPADQTPEQYVNEYYQLTIDGDYDSAFVMLPTATQASYGDSASYAAQLQGYGITGFSVAAQVEQDGNIYVTGTTETPQMPISYTWTFVQGEDGTWLAAGREMGGM